MTKIANLLSLDSLNVISPKGTMKLKGGKEGNNRNKNKDKPSVEELSNGNACPPPR